MKGKYLIYKIPQFNRVYQTKANDAIIFVWSTLIFDLKLLYYNSQQTSYIDAMLVSRLRRWPNIEQTLLAGLYLALHEWYMCRPTLLTGDSLTHHSGKSFTTIDNDNDNVRDDNCAAIAKGGWWYRKCHRSNLNGLYLNGDHTGCCEAEGMEWRDWGNQNTGYYYSYLASVMKIRPDSF